MRLYGISSSDIGLVVRNPIRRERDEHGNLRLTGLSEDRHAIIVVIAGDNPNFVITTFPES